MNEKIEEIHKMAQIALGKQVDKDCTKWAIKEGFFDNFEALYDAGYRKESDTAKEIFEKLLGWIGSQQQFCVVDEEHKTLIDCDKLFNFVGNLAKEKYGVDLGE